MNMSEERKLIERLMEHFEAQMEYMPDPKKVKDVELATYLLDELFGAENVEVGIVLGEVGTLVLSVELESLNVRGEEELMNFALVSDIADEIMIETSKDGVLLSVVIENIYTNPHATKFTLV